MAYAYDWFIDDNPEVRKRVRKSREESLAEGLAMGEAKGLQQSALLIIGSRFPTLKDVVRPAVERITVVDELNQLITQLLTASSEEEARKLLNC